MRYEKFENIVVIAIAAGFAVVQIYFALAATRGALHVNSPRAADAVLTQHANQPQIAAAHSNS